MDEEKIRVLIRKEIGKPLKIIYNDFKKPEPKPVHPIVYIIWIAVGVAFLYLMYKAYTMAN